MVLPGSLSEPGCVDLDTDLSSLYAPRRRLDSQHRHTNGGAWVGSSRVARFKSRLSLWETGALPIVRAKERRRFALVGEGPPLTGSC